MKKIIYCLIIILSAINTIYSQTVIFSENFESIVPPARPDGWTQEKVVGSIQVDWETKSGGNLGNPSSAAEGSYNAIFQYQSSNGEATKLISPVIDLSDIVKPELTFQHAQDIWYVDKDFWDQLKIYYKRGADSAWVLLEEYLYPVPNWVGRSILLPDSSLSSTYYIAFEGITGYGHGTCIDDIKITETGLIPLYVQSVNVSQTNNNFIPTETNNNPILRVEFNVLGNVGILNLDSISFHSLNTSDENIVSNGVKIFATEDTIFNTLNLIGAGNFTDGIITFDNVNHSIPRGLSAIWLTYDIKEDVNHEMFGDIADAMIKESGIKIENSYYPFLDKSPNGSRTIYETVFKDDFETDKGWRLTGEFERAIPLGLHANSLGNADPDYAFSNDYIIGTDLTIDGNYSDEIPDTGTVAEAPTFNFKYYKDIVFSYYRWLNIQSYIFDRAKILVSVPNDTVWQEIWGNPQLSILNENMWSFHSFNLSPYFERNEKSKIKFTLGNTNTNNNYTGWNIDDFVIVGNFISKDVGITNWIAPIDGCRHNTNEEYVEITIQNFAGEVLNEPLTISYSFDQGATIVYDTILAPNIPIDGSINYIIDKPVDLSIPGWYNNVYATTHLSGDEDNINDKYTRSFFITPTYDLPYYENFETNYGYYLSGGTNSTWEYGIPANILISSAASGTKAWVTNLDGDYLTSDSSYLESPCFNFAGSDSIIFEFKCKGISEDKTDGLSLLYSTDEGGTWNLVADNNDFYWNWYTESLISALELPGIDITNGEWLVFKQLLPPAVSNQNSVKFKFIFESDASTTDEGFGIDDIKIYEAPYDVGVSSLAYPFDQCEWSDTTHVKVLVKNYGIIDVKAGTKIPLVLNFNSEISNDTLTLANDLTVGNSVLFTFNSTVNMSYAGGFDFIINTNLESNTYFYNETVSNDTVFATVTVEGMPNYDIGWIVGSDDLDTLLDAGAGYTTYSWDSLGFEVSTSQTYRATKAGIYYVTVTNDSLCVATDSLRLVPSLTDVKMDSILTELEDSCERFELTEIRVTISNKGQNLLDGVNDTIPFGYQINNLPEVHDTLVLVDRNLTTATDPATDTINFIFTNKCDLTEIGEYTISVFTNFADDLNRTDDTVTTVINTWGLPVANLAYDTIYSSQADTLTLDAGSGFASYLWNPGDSITQTITPTNSSYYYKVTVTDVNACGSDKDSTYIETHDFGISAVISPVNICEDLASATTSLSVEVTNYSAIIYSSPTTVKIFYNYDNGGWLELNPEINVGAFGTVIINDIATIDATTVGEHTLKIYTSSNIDANHTNDTIDYVFNTWPLPDVNLAYDTIYTTRADTIILIAQQGLGSYLWDDASTNDSLIIDNNLTHEYRVEVTDINGCGTDADSTLVITYNLGVTSLFAPTSNCQHSSTETVILKLKNYGSDIISSGTSIPIGYIIDEGIPVTQNYNLIADLDPSATVNIPFTQKADLSTIGSYKFKVFSGFELDVNRTNDTIVDVIKTFGNPNIELGDDVYTTTPLSETLTAASGFTTYKWSDGSTNQSLNVSYPASRLYSITVTDINGCIATDDINVFTFDIAASELITPFSQCELTNSETVNFDIINNSLDTLLSGETINVSYILNSGSPVNESFNLSIDSLKPTETVNYTFTQTANLSANQVHEIELYAELASVDVKTDDALTRNVDYQKPTFDLGADINTGNTQYTIDAGSGYESYLWFDDSDESTYLVDINDQNPGNIYSVTVTNSYGCSANDEIEVIFTTTPDLAVTAMLTPESGCWNDGAEYPVQIEITNSGVVNLNPGDNFIVGYKIDEGTAVTETFNVTTTMGSSETRNYTFTDEISFSSAKIYLFKPFVKLTNDGDVNNDTLTTGTIVEITAPEVILGANDTISTPSTSYEIQLSESYSTYLWDDDDNSTTPTLTVTETGRYSVTVTDGYGCSGEGSIYINFLTDVNNLIQGDGYKLTYFPNPVSEQLMIQFENKKSKDVIIEIVSANGQLVYNNKISNVENSIEKIDVTSFSNGIYYIRFNIDDEFYIRKIIIQ